MAAEFDRLKAALADRYVVKREIGRGGMATVFLAEDLKHERRVAIKVIDDELAATLGAERFLREIRLAAQLTHPHILPLFDSGDMDGVLYYVMPYVEGESLRARLDREKQLSLEDALKIAREVADALSYAHSQDVVHRDIKPENILLESDHAVVADFGLALAISEAGGDRLTKTGILVGTPTYMSPEQAAGERRLDGRTDLYSLACVLYEMLAGQPPFTGASAETVVAQHLGTEAHPITTYRPAVPAEVAAVLARALSKAPADRFSPAAQFAEALNVSAAPQIVSGAGRPSRTPVAVAVLGLAALTTATFFALRSRSPPTPLSVPQPTQITHSGDIAEATLSHDGDFLALIVQRTGEPHRLLVQEVGGGAPLEIYSHDWLCCAQWAPDGSQILFRAGTRGDGRNLLLSRLGGGTPRQIESEISSAWSPDGTRIVSWWAQSDTLWLTDVATGSKTESIVLDMPHVWINGADWDPAGSRIAFGASDENGFLLWTVDVNDGEFHRVLFDSMLVMSPRWGPGGRDLYYLRAPDARGMEIMRVGVAPDGPPAGSPQLVQAGLTVRMQHQSMQALSISRNGDRVAYTRLISHSNLWLYEVEDDGSLSPRSLTTGTAGRWNPRLSPDGESVAFVEATSARQDISIMSLDGEQRQLTFMETDTWGPAWAPDGARVAFGAGTRGAFDVWVVDREGGSPRRLPDTDLDGDNRLAWAPASDILYQLPEDRNYHFVDPDVGTQRALLSENVRTGWLYEPRVSPDGRRLAVWFNRTDDQPDGLWTFSTEDGSEALLLAGFHPIEWADDGATLYAMPHTEDDAGHTEIYRVSVASGQPVLHAVMPSPVQFRHVAITPDGRRIVAAVDLSQSDAVVIDSFDPARAGS